MGYIADRYARAVTSSNLRVQARTPGDADVLIASGLASQKLFQRAPPLASMLYRLRIEYDKVDKRSLARVNVTTTNVLLALTHVRSLLPARKALQNFVEGQAWREGMELDVETLERVADRVLDHFLDPICGACNGVQFKVVIGTGRLSGVACSKCLGSGRRLLVYGDAARAEEYELTRAVRDAITRKMNKFDQRVGNLLRM